jgi:cbb3-type cytochrome oxidase maturation protein
MCCLRLRRSISLPEIDMDILFILIPLTLLLVVFGCWAFFWAVDAGQFDDLDAPAWDAVNDDVDADRKITIVSVPARLLTDARPK